MENKEVLRGEIKNSEEITVSCINCHKEVKVKLIPYGGGKIAMCPICNKLAYNGN